MPLIFGDPLHETTGRIRRFRSAPRWGWSRSLAEQGFRSAPEVAGTPCDGRDAADQGEGLGDVVDVRRGRDDLQRGTASVADQMALAACLPPVDRRRAGVGAPSFRADVRTIHALT